MLRGIASKFTFRFYDFTLRRARRQKNQKHDGGPKLQNEPVHGTVQKPKQIQRPQDVDQKITSCGNHQGHGAAAEDDAVLISWADAYKCQIDGKDQEGAHQQGAEGPSMMNGLPRNQEV